MVLTEGSLMRIGWGNREGLGECMVVGEVRVKVQEPAPFPHFLCALLLPNPHLCTHLIASAIATTIVVDTLTCRLLLLRLATVPSHGPHPLVNTCTYMPRGEREREGRGERGKRERKKRGVGVEREWRKWAQGNGLCSVRNRMLVARKRSSISLLSRLLAMATN
jgi:hypothetical protein